MALAFVPEKVAELERLLHLVEEHFNVPAGAVEVADTPRAPGGVVADEDHQAFLAIDLHPRLHPAESPAFELLPFDAGELDDLILDHPASLPERQVAQGAAAEVVLGPRHPLHSACIEIMQMHEVHVGLVEDDDFALLKSGADLASAPTVMLTGGVDNGKGGQKAVEAQAQMQLCRRLASAMLGPVHAVGLQFHDRRINRVDAYFETVKHSA